jgi:hypothetical protein
MNEAPELYEDIKKELLPFESWERLTGESAAAYAAFRTYRDYGADRNIRKAVEADCKKQHGEYDQGKITKRYRMWRLWSMQFRWVKRTEDYDLYIDRLKQTEVRKTIEARGEAHREVTGKMLMVVNKKLDMMNPDDLSQGTVTEWVETAIRTEREILNQRFIGLMVGKEKAETAGGKPGSIQFTPEFEGL